MRACRRFARDSPGPASTVIGVGIDTVRYGHHAAFLNDRLQTAAPDLEILESAQGYAQLRQRLVDLVRKHGRVHFHVRLDFAHLKHQLPMARVLDHLGLTRRLKGSGAQVPTFRAKSQVCKTPVGCYPVVPAMQAVPFYPIGGRCSTIASVPCKPRSGP